MKNIYLCFLLLCGCGILNSYAQPVSNGGFENWSYRLYYENPNGFMTTNFVSYVNFYSSSALRISPGVNSSNAVSLITRVTPSAPIPGLMYYANAQNNPSQGLPYPGRPDSLKFHYQCDVQSGDTANLLAVIRGNGSVLAFVRIDFTGQTNNWTSSAKALTWIDPVTPPDTLVLIASSSSISGVTALDGSRLDLDELQFIGTNAPQPPFGDFEQWNQAGSDEPEDWKSINFLCDPADLSVTQSSDAYAGSSALQLKTVVSVFGDTLGIFTNGIFADQPDGGMPIAQNPLSITGYYKYTPVGPDTALILSFTYFYDFANQSKVRVDSSLVMLTPTSTYQPFTLPFLYNGWNLPDTLNITIASGNLLRPGAFNGVGSTLLIDELSIQYSPVGEPQPLFGNSALPYPMPASSWVNIPLDKTLNGSNIEIFDATGKSVFLSKISGTNLQLDVHHWNNGVYFYRCYDEQSKANGRFIIQH